MIGGDGVNEQPMNFMGEVIDMTMDKFAQSLDDQKVNLGTMQNLILWLENTYAQLRSSKDEVISRCMSGVLRKDSSEVQKSLNGLYAEMLKTEEKVVYLKNRCREIGSPGENTN